ncbi:MAG TPA: CHRD domain-containing protein [Jiangellaceae bacterium]|nr:CHRD domain-containing protein [Jiangellaceae bacterium]
MPRQRRRTAVIAMLSLAVAIGMGTVATASSSVMNMTTHLSTAEEVPTPVFDSIDRNPQGEAVIRLSQEGELTYRLNVANIENVLMAHIHIAPPGSAGPIVVWLYPNDPPLAPRLISGFSNGPLTTGTITDADLTGPLAGGTVEDLLAQVRAGNAYVNVHTDQNRPGEIRGQIQHHEPAGD